MFGIEKQKNHQVKEYYILLWSYIIPFLYFIVLATLFEYINYRLLKLPSTIDQGNFLVLIVFGEQLFPKTATELEKLLKNFDFTDMLMGGMLNFLLFAGAIHLNIKDLKERFVPVYVVCYGRVVISAFVVGIGVYYILPLVGFKIPFIYCMVFGTLISPTDPVAVLGILKKVKVSKSLETKVTGESLFNDGVSVVVFAVILQLAVGEKVNIILFWEKKQGEVCSLGVCSGLSGHVP